MGSMVEACAECRKKCLLCHVKRRKSTPLVSSFFKVMITKRFSEVLFLPPKFAPTVSTLIDKEIPLEDSSGLQWKVKLTILENSLALHQGWDTFAFDHGLEVGDFVIFHYILGSHFVVQIFDKTGCEKLDFSGNKNLKRKRAKADRKSTKKCGPCHSTDKGSIGKQGSNSSAFFDSNVEISQGQCKINDAINIKMAICGTSNDENGVARPQAVSKAEFFEEPFSIINREVGDKEAAYRTAICDLSSLEMLTYNLDIDRNNKILVGAKKSSHNADPSLNSKNEVGSDCKGSLNSVPLLASKSPPKPKKNLGSDSKWSNGIHRRCQTDERTEKVQSSKLLLSLSAEYM
ncbi:hypothetical protein P3X46_027710 [Hevea brasiliensis]|uniref:TF-B3 domain-containing protein n=1 Tax=Hevea brasiliensis TaxID=3981 RepID=A0ABQ9L1Q0_HEVBR|nr:hypothetical protein P3X46_027710 [Hevea brasiliensis]